MENEAIIKKYKTLIKTHIASIRTCTEKIHELGGSIW